MIFKGVVENNKANGRVQVRVYGIHSQDTSTIPTEALPWAEVQGSTNFGLLDGVGVSSVLRIGTWVYVDFIGGDEESPIVTGVVIGDDDHNTLVQDNYQEVQTLKTTSGHIIEFSEVDGDERITITHKSGTKINLDNEGTFNIESVKDLNVTVAGNANLTTTGNTTLTSTGSTAVTASDVTVNASGAASITAPSVNVTGTAVTVTATTLTLASALTILGVGDLKQIARLGDAVQVSTSTGTGTITACTSLNTSA